MTRVIAFLTDYGRRDGFVAACHGVMIGRVPDVRVIDISHDVPPQDVRHGAVILAQTVPYLPPSVVVGVVDPGVGSQRRGIALAAGDHLFVGPDNGLLIWAAGQAGSEINAVELTAPDHRLPTQARTFHGRDVFAPAAAHLAGGGDLGDLGPAVPEGELTRLPEPRTRVGPGAVQTEAHVIDHFGNVALAATADHLASAGLGVGDRVRIASSGLATGTLDVAVGTIFADVAPGQPVLYVDSHGHAAVAVNQGNAAAALGVVAGDQITLTVE